MPVPAAILPRAGALFGPRDAARPPAGEDAPGGVSGGAALAGPTPARGPDRFEARPERRLAPRDPPPVARVHARSGAPAGGLEFFIQTPDAQTVPVAVEMRATENAPTQPRASPCGMGFPRLDYPATPADRRGIGASANGVVPRTATTTGVRSAQWVQALAPAPRIGCTGPRAVRCGGRGVSGRSADRTGRQRGPFSEAPASFAKRGWL